jgi:hypothetical protein
MVYYYFQEELQHMTEQFYGGANNVCGTTENISSNCPNMWLFGSASSLILRWPDLTGVSSSSI